MNKLKSKSIKSVLVLSIFFVIIGMVMIGTQASSILLLLKGPQDLAEVDFSEDVDGTYVKTTLQFIYDPYAEETTDGRITAYEYIIDANKDYYMGLRVNSDDFKKSEALLNASYDYFDEKIDADELEEYAYEVKGTIKKMPSDSASLYRSYFRECDFTSAEINACCLEYYLEVNQIGNTTTIPMVLLIGGGLVFFAIAIFMLAKAGSGKYQKLINDYIASSPNSVATREKIETFLANAPELHKLQYDSCFICGQNGATTIFGETDKLVWAYKHTVAHKRYFITVAKTHSVMLYFLDGKQQQFTVSKESHADEILGMLNQLCPKAILGYNNELSNMYSKDFRGFLNLRYYAPQETDAHVEIEE